ncbi:MAG: hypothetical protein ACPGU6_06430 [Tenacibaculum sp.]
MNKQENKRVKRTQRDYNLDFKLVFRSKMSWHKINTLKNEKYLQKKAAKTSSF